MTRIVTKAFTLNLPEGQKPFVVGDKLEGTDADHWYSQSFSDELVVEKAETAAEKRAREKAEKAAAEAAAAQAQAEADAAAAAAAAANATQQ
jgi:hypothetical protein